MGLCNHIFTFLVFLVAPFVWYGAFAVFVANYYPAHPLVSVLVHNPIQAVRPVCDHCPAQIGSLLYKRPQVFIPAGLPKEPLPALLTWLEENLAGVDKVELGSFDGLRGLKAVAEVQEGQAALTVPFHCTLNAATFSGRESVKAATASWSTEEDATIFFTPLALLYEALVQKNTSTWAPYIATLPLEYTLPINMLDPRAKKMLSALPDLHRLTKEWRWLLVRFYPKFMEAFKELPGAVQALEGMRAADVWNAYIWAYSASKTRSVTVQRDELSKQDQAVLPSWVHDMGVMVPLLDMANHGVGQQANAAFKTSAASVPTGKKSKASKTSKVYVQLLATKDVHPGQQVMPSYGGFEEDMDNKERLASHCDADWLLEYGFIIQDGSPERHCFAARMNAQNFPLAGHSACALLGWAPQDKHLFKLNARDGQPVLDLLQWTVQSFPTDLPEWAIALGNKTFAAIGAQASLETVDKQGGRSADQVKGSNWHVDHASKHARACVEHVLDVWVAKLEQAKPKVGEKGDGGKKRFWGGEGCGLEKQCAQGKDSAQEAGVQMLEQVVDGAIAALTTAKSRLNALDMQEVTKMVDS